MATVPSATPPDPSKPLHTRGTRIPPNLFGIPFGIASLADVWNTTAPVLGTSRWVPNALDILAAVVLITVCALYLAQGPRQVLEDLRDQIVSPFVSLAVITPMKLSAALADYTLSAAQILVGVFLALTVLFGGWLTGQWVAGAIDQDAPHPGYFLPTVAGCLVGAFAAAEVHWHGIAEASFGIGIVCWFLLGSLILNRLIVRSGLPAPLVPTLAIEIAPPAVAGIAYYAITGGATDMVAAALAGYTVLMALVQLSLVPQYARLRFSPALWAFTFAYGAAATYALLWIAAKHPPGATAYAAVVTGLTTLLIGTIFVRSALAVARGSFLSRPVAPGSQGPMRTSHPC
jgi:tellurite resistance protein